ncbi:MAG: DUF362 domain-containing protein [Candidatus Bathyarchaeota archaeon]|nr:DUF362 domain-containing protein [Candidatus Bathyarchaeota archaeon]
MSLVGLTEIQENLVKQAILKSLSLINYSFERNIKRIVIKPNLCYYWDYSTGQTTDPLFVAALIDLLREKISKDIDIAIAESDASAMKCKYAFRFLNYEKIAKEYDVRLVNLSEDETSIHEVAVGTERFQIAIPRTITEADLRINLPKIKYTMEEIKITCALKNVFGCNPYPQKFKYHSKLSEAIVAINKAMPFDLCIIDGNIVSGVKPQRLGLVMASVDPVAIDAAAAKIAGVNPKKIKYLQLAAKEGLGNIKFVERGLHLAQFASIYPKKGLKEKLMGKAYGLVIKMKLGKRLGLA